MAFPLINPYQQFFDSSGSPLASGTIEFRDPTTNNLINSYPTADDADAQTNANDNPLTLSASGAAANGLYLEDGVKYKIVLKNAAGATVTTQDDVACPLDAWFTTQTAAESTASVTPTDYSYEPGDVRRYGATGNGSTDDSTAVENAIKSNAEVYFPEGLTYKLSSAVTIASDTVIRAYGATIDGGGIDSNADLFDCVSAVDVRVRGGDYTDARYAFYFTTAFDTLDIQDATFEGVAIPILIHSVAATDGKVEITNCRFNNVEIGIDLQSSPIGMVNIDRNYFTNVAFQTLSTRPSPLDKKIVSGLWYQAISGSAGVSVANVTNNFVDGVTGPSSGDVNEKEVHGLAVSLDNSLDCDVVMDGNVVLDTAGHSTLDLGDEGLLGRGRSVVMTNNILRDAGSTEGCIYAKGSAYVIASNNHVEASGTNSRLSYMTGIIASALDTIVSNNRFVGLPEGVKTRSLQSTVSNNEFRGCTSSILQALEDGDVNEYVVIDGNIQDEDCTAFFGNQTADGSTATQGDTYIRNNIIYGKGGTVSIKAATNFVFENNVVHRSSPDATREAITTRADKTITNCFVRGNVFSNFQDSNTTGRVMTITNDTGTGKASCPNLHITDNFFGTGTLALVLGSHTYDDVLIKDNMFSAPAAAISSSATVNNNYIVKDNINANIDTITATTTELEDNSALVNTSNAKVEGYMIFNTTTDKPVYAAGSADGDVWVDATGSTAHTPV
jgi:hypothetical protein